MDSKNIALIENNIFETAIDVIKETGYAITSIHFDKSEITAFQHPSQRRS